MSAILQLFEPLQVLRSVDILKGPRVVELHVLGPAGVSVPDLPPADVAPQGSQLRKELAGEERRRARLTATERHHDGRPRRCHPHKKGIELIRPEERLIGVDEGCRGHPVAHGSEAGADGAGDALLPLVVYQALQPRRKHIGQEGPELLRAAAEDDHNLGCQG